MVRVTRRWRRDIKFEFIVSLVFTESKLRLFGVVFNVDDIIDCELKSFKCRVELLDGVRPTIAIG